MTNQKKRDYTIQTVSNALDVLEQFNGDITGLGITDLSRSLHLPKNNVFRLLATLQSRNYIQQNMSTEKYGLGHRAFELSQNCARQLDRFKKTRVVMGKMVIECNETVCFSVLRDSNVINLDAVECDHRVRVYPRIGESLPAHCTSAGKVMIANYTADKLGRFVSNHELQQFTQNTIINLDLFIQDLCLVAQRGYATEIEELDLGVASISAPIYDHTLKKIGAVTCVGPTQRFTDSRMFNELIPIVIKGAADISTQLGYC